MKRWIAALLFLAALAVPSHAQFVGFVGLQTVTATPIVNTACTGSPQTAVVANAGQISHFVSATVTAGTTTSFSMLMQGSFNGTSGWVNISNASSDIVNNASIIGQGYYPVVRINVTCLPVTASFTVTYSGTNGSIGAPLGSALVNTVNSVMASQKAGNINFTGTVVPPYLNSGGVLQFAYTNGQSVAGSTLSVNCADSDASFTFPSSIFPIANNTAPQFFYVTGLPCGSASVTYTSGGATAATYSFTYYFNAPGVAAVQDPCQSPAVPKSSVPINITSATTTSLVAPSANSIIFVCGFNVQTVAGTFTLEYGTGATCGTGTVAMTGAFPAGSVIFGGAGQTVAPTAGGGQRLCALTGVGLTNAQGLLTYVQQ